MSAYNSAHTTLILYSEIFSSEENLNYWQSKLEDQLQDRNPFGLVALISSSEPPNNSPGDMKDDYKKWMKEIRPALESCCYGHAVVSKDENVIRKYHSNYLRKISETTGCDCCFFTELEEALKWLNEKESTNKRWN